MRALCVGESKYNTICFVDNLPLEGSITNIKEQIDSSGGSAYLVATLLAKWNVETYLKTAVGSDSSGELLKKEAENNNIKIQQMETNFDKKTAKSFILVNKKTLTKTVYNLASYDNLPSIKKLDNMDIELKVLYVDGTEYHASNVALNRYTNAIKVVGIKNTDSETLDLCKMSDYLIFNKETAEMLTKSVINIKDSTTVLNTYNMLISRFPGKEIVIVLENFGTIYKNNSVVKLMPGLRNETKNLPAEFDMFIGAFVYGLISNYQIEQNIMFSNISLGLSEISKDNKLEIPSLPSVISYYNSKRENVNKSS